MFCSSRRRKEKKQKKINFHKHGSLLLEELIASSGGKYNPIRTFSSDQILQATNNFDRSYMISVDRFNPIRTFSSNQILQATNNFDRSYMTSVDRFVWYKGTIENRAVLIKYDRDGNYLPDNYYRDIAISSMMSSHKNVLKLLGCFLEFPHPVLVFEYPENGSLSLICDGPERESIKPLPWNVRLKIAKEIAYAVTYLHTEFPRTIIHRDLKPSYVFLDENLTAKLSSFSLSIPIPEGESGVEATVVESDGYTEPVYMRTGFVTENVDVYKFGFLMLSLLTGKSGMTRDPNKSNFSDITLILTEYVRKFVGRGMFTKLIDPSMLNGADDDIRDHSRLQMEAFFDLALRCVRFRGVEIVPRMIDVAKQLKQIEEQT